MSEPTRLCLTCRRPSRKMATLITCQRCIDAVTRENAPSPRPQIKTAGS